MIYAALYLAIAQVLPFITGQIPEFGAMLCPMHLPALLCGFVCGWPWGLAVGFLAPLLRGVLFGMPALYPTGVAMAFELAAYGAFAGVLYRHLPRGPLGTYLALILAMALGRLIWGAAQWILSGIAHSEFTAALFLTRAVTDALPGILLQLILIPPLVIAMERTGLALNEQKADAA